MDKYGNKTGGREEHKPNEKTRQLVKVLAGVMAEQNIANALSISRNTLRKYYPQELKEGKDFFLGQAITSLMNNIKKGKEASIFFYLKTQHGWKEQDTSQDINITINQEPDYKYPTLAEIDRLKDVEPH